MGGHIFKMATRMHKSGYLTKLGGIFKSCRVVVACDVRVAVFVVVFAIGGAPIGSSCFLSSSICSFQRTEK